MLDNLFKKYKSNREKYSNFYEKEFLKYRHKPLNLLQVGVENSIPAWHKLLLRCNIYCIDEFDKREPNKYKYLNQERVFWSRCDTSSEKSIKEVMKEKMEEIEMRLALKSANTTVMH